MRATGGLRVVRRGAALGGALPLLLAGCYSYQPYGYGYPSQPGFYSSPPPGAYSTSPQPSFLGPGTTVPPGSTFPPGGVPGGTVPPGGAFPPGGSFPPAGGTFPPAGNTFPPAGNTFPPAGNTFPPGGTYYPPPGGSTSPALQPFGQPTPIDTTPPRTWRDASPGTSARDPEPFTSDATKNYNSSPPATPPRNRPPADVLAPNPDKLDPFPSNGTAPRSGTFPAPRPFKESPATKPRGTPSNTQPPFGEEGSSPFSSTREPARLKSDGSEIAVRKVGPNLSGPVLASPEEIVPTAAVAVESADDESPATAHASVEPADAAQAAVYDYDRADYRWLRGVVDFDETDGTWFVVYASVPEEGDFYQGGLTLVGSTAQFEGLQNGDVVSIEGQIDAASLDRRQTPVYRVASIIRAAAE